MEEGRYKFTFPVLPVQETPQVAEIRLNQPHHTFNKWKISIVMPRPSGLHHGSTKFFRKTLPYRKDGVWDISSVVIPLLDRFRGNITMELKATHLKKIGHKNRVVPKDPIVVLYSTDKSFLGEINKLKSDLSSQRSKNLLRSRTKRTAQEHKTGRKRRRNKWKQNKNGTELCKLHKFRVDFDLIGWGRWIVHPKKFNAKACFGQCPAPITHEYTPTNHAMLQTLMRMKRPLSAPEPCCVPTKLRPLSMLYFEYDDIVVRYHQDMVAAECGCR